MDTLRHDQKASSDDDLKRILDDQASMSTETKLTQEIQDILDELNSLIRVYKEQRTVIGRLAREYNSILENMRVPRDRERRSQQSSSTGERAEDVGQSLANFEPLAISDLLQVVESRQLEFEELRSQAGRVYDTASSSPSQLTRRDANVHS